MRIGTYLSVWAGAAVLSLIFVGCKSKETASLPPPAAAPAVAGAPPSTEPSKPKAALDPDDKLVDYKVAKGDSLWLIAQKFNTSVGKIQTANNLSGNKIVEGRTLKIPTKNPPSAEELAAGAPAAATAKKEDTAPKPAAAAPEPPAPATPPSAPAVPAVEPPAPPASGSSFSFPAGGLKIQD